MKLDMFVQNPEQDKCNFLSAVKRLMKAWTIPLHRSRVTKKLGVGISFLSQNDMFLCSLRRTNRNLSKIGANDLKIVLEAAW
jgi:hypothetical protein